MNRFGPTLLAAFAFALGACDSDDPPDEASSESSGSSADTDPAGSGGGSGSDPTGDSAAAVPTDPDALLEWLQSDSYRQWDVESSVHPSTGPHFGDVLTFFDPSLVGSFEAGEDEHPVGAASVKELYGDSSEVRGWAVRVKVPDDGGTWYWYEYFDDRVIASGNAIALCESCHDDGIDLVLTPYPLE